jgi:hypothetical protein
MNEWAQCFGERVMVGALRNRAQQHDLSNGKAAASPNFWMRTKDHTNLTTFHYVWFPLSRSDVPWVQQKESTRGRPPMTEGTAERVAVKSWSPGEQNDGRKKLLLFFSRRRKTAKETKLTYKLLRFPASKWATVSVGLVRTRCSDWAKL